MKEDLQTVVYQYKAVGAEVEGPKGVIYALSKTPVRQQETNAPTEGEVNAINDSISILYLNQ